MSNFWLAPEAWDATRLRALMLCRRRFWLEQVLQLRPIGASGEFSIDLEFGTAWHECTRAYDTARLGGSDNPLHSALLRAIRVSGDWPSDLATSAKCRASLVRSLIWYDEQFGANNPLRPLIDERGAPAMELNFSFPLFADRPNGPMLCGNLDGIVEFGGEIWILERKTTASALSGFYWAKYDPNVQIDCYALAAHLLWPQWRVQGVMVEALQTGATFSRFERRQFRRTLGRLEESLRTIQLAVSDLERDLDAVGGDFTQAEVPNFTACNDGRGCPFKPYCQTDPSMREWALKTQFVPRERPWNPLAGNVKEAENAE